MAAFQTQHKQEKKKNLEKKKKKQTSTRLKAKNTEKSPAKSRFKEVHYHTKDHF